MTLIKFSGKPIEKLIETVSAGIGVLYKPRAIRKEADAEAYKMEKLEEAKAKALILKADTEYEILERAKQRFVHQEVNRQTNLDNIVEKSTKHLKDTVSEQPVDEDWRTRFFNRAQDVTSDEMQEIWSKILATEVTTPSTVSLRTLDIVSNLTKQDAEVFQKAAKLSFSNGYILKIGPNNAFDEFGLTYSDLLQLRAADLIFENDNLNITFNHVGQLNGTIIIYGNRLFKVSKVNTTKYTFNQVKFTPAGEELLKTLEIEHDSLYINKFIEEKTKEGFSFEEIKIEIQP